MNAKAPHAKMEERVQTMLTLTPVPVGLALLASTVKPTYLTALRVPVSMEGHAQTKSMAIPVPAAQASLALIASMRSMSVTPSPVSMGVSVRMAWSPSVALAPRALLETAVRHQLTGADAPLPVKMEGAVARRMLHISVNVLVAGLDVIVTSPESPVRQLLAREGSKQMSYATMAVTVSTQGMPTTVNALLITLAVIVKAK